MDAIMGLTLSQLIGRIAGIIAVASVFIEITPIKVNPISHILKWIGSQLNKDITDKISNMEKKIDLLERADIISSRVRILRLSDEIRHGDKHSQEMFDQVLADIDTYDKYCDKHQDFKNNKTVAAKQKILEVYSNCIDNNDFL